VYHRENSGRNWVEAGGRWYSLGEVAEAVFHWLGLKDSFCYWLTAELGYQATSQTLWLGQYWCFLDSTGSSTSPSGAGPISPHDITRIFFNMLKCCNFCWAILPTCHGLSASKYATWERVKSIGRLGGWTSDSLV
jgi:hypothetical protein